MIRILVSLLLGYVVIGKDVHADQIREDLGVTRASMIRGYEADPLTFTFGMPDRLHDGTPRISGHSNACPEGYLTLELIGPPGVHLSQASVTFASTEDTSGPCSLNGVLAFVTLLQRVYPDWMEGPEWLSEALLEGKDTTIYREGLFIKLRILYATDGKIVTLIVDSG